MKSLVTGAASGIGRATALKLHRNAVKDSEPSQLLLLDIAAEGLETLAAELRADGAQVEVFVGDLADEDVPARALDTASKAFGGLDALISNAGIISRVSLLELDVAGYERSFAVHTRATWLLGKAAHPLLKASKGCIVATASISAGQPTPPLGAYSASKAALVMLVRQMSVEWGIDGIRCNCVSPGSTHTAMNDARYSDPKQRAEAAKKNPLQTVGLPENQADAIAFLASPAAAYITGANLLVDGGLQNMLMVASAMGDPWTC